MKSLQLFLKEKRKQVGLTQTEFADRAGVALTVIRKIEQGKGNLNMETVNHVLLMFGHALAPVPAKTIESNQEKDHEESSRILS
jgi:y4mF family transcriptional regulator